MRGISSPNLVLLLLVLLATVTLAVLGVRALNQEITLKQLESSHRQETTMKTIEANLVSEIEKSFLNVRKSIESQEGNRRGLRKLVMSNEVLDQALIYDDDLNRIFPPDKIQALPREQHLLAQFETVIENQVQSLSAASAFNTLPLGYAAELRLLHCWYSQQYYCALMKPSWLATELKAALARIDQSGQIILNVARNEGNDQAKPSPPNAQLTWKMSGIFADWQLNYRSNQTPENHLLPIYVAILFPLIVLMIGLGVWLFGAQRRFVKESQRKTDFLRLVAHEFKTPLANLRLYSDLVRRSDSQQETLGYMDVFDAEFFRMRRFLNNAILFEHPELNAQPKLETLCLKGFIKQLIQPFEPRLKSSGIDLSTDFQITGKLTVAREALECAVVNLIDNLIKYAPNHPAELIVTQQDDCLCITCRDGGEGITPELQSTLFQYQHQQNTSKDGFGLGLGVTKQLLESAGGQIAYENTKGSTFSIQLPVQEIEESR